MKTSEEEQWISISDLMAGLMVVFLFIALAFILRNTKQVDYYKEVRLKLFHELKKEFETDLKKWNAELDQNELSIRFKDIEVLFKQGQSQVPEHFKTILDDFFPRYLNILTNVNYIDQIKEVKIKGHTSSEGKKKSQDRIESYFFNMELSQDRTRNVLNYVMKQPTSVPHRNWLIKTITANGLSSSQIIKKPNGKEDHRLSRRVEFEIQTRVDKILKNSKTLN